MPFEKALAELVVANDEVLMIGDMPDKDVLGANNMGFVSCFAKYGNSEVASGVSCADYEAKTPLDILRIVDIFNKTTN